MGFLSGLFGKRESIAVELNEVREFVEKERAKTDVLERAVPEIFAEIKHSIKEIRALLDEVEKLPIKSENERFEKAVETSRKQAVKRLRALLQKIEPPFDASAQQIADYCYESKLSLQKEIFASGKSIAYTSALLAEHMRAIGKNFKSIDESLEKLRLVINANPIVFSTMIEKLLSDIEKKKADLETLEQKLSELEGSLKSVEEKKAKAKEKLDKLKSSKQARMLEELERKEKELAEKRALLRERLQLEIADIKKALQRLKKANDRGVYLLKERELKTISLLFEEPLSLIKIDPKGEHIKALLNELENAIKQNAVTLKERGLVKTQNAILKLAKKDFFNEFFWPLNELEGETLKIQKELRKNTIIKAIQQAEQELKHSERELSEVKKEISESEQKKSKLKEELAVLIKNLQEVLSSTLKKDIKIVVNAEKKSMKNGTSSESS
ncbi:MAG: hypothetical protein J7J87_04190 [Candidatus Diapherotrites archaeon]|nr:hypothetical protein [Candidatus Diapherotrites archaeon]